MNKSLFFFNQNIDKFVKNLAPLIIKQPLIVKKSYPPPPRNHLKILKIGFIFEN